MGDEGADGEHLSAAACTQAILHLLDQEQGNLTILQESLEEKEQLELAAQAAAFSIPDTSAADKLLRYETTLERQLYRAMDQLERLQRQRCGQAVPPPITIDVDHAG